MHFFIGRDFTRSSWLLSRRIRLADRSPFV
jgi:hypothetical protein